MCIYTYTWLHRDCIWITAGTKLYRMCNIFTQIRSGVQCWLDIYHWGARLEVTGWIWHWTKRFTIPAINCRFQCPNENHMSIAFPVQLYLQRFCNNTWMVSIGFFCSHSMLFCEWTVYTFWKTYVEGNNKHLQREVKILRWQIFAVLLTELLDFLDPKTQFFTLQNFLNWCLSYISWCPAADVWKSVWVLMKKKVLHA